MPEPFTIAQGATTRLLIPPSKYQTTTTNEGEIMAGENFSVLDKHASLEDWTVGDTRWDIMLQTSFEDKISDNDIPTYLTISLAPDSEGTVLVHRHTADEERIGPPSPFEYMPNSGQIHGSIEVTLEDGSDAPMFFIISMVFMQDDDKPEDPDAVAKYLSSITLIGDPETAGVMGAEAGSGGGPNTTLEN